MNKACFNVLLLLPVSMFCVHFSSTASEVIPKQRSTSIAIDEQTKLFDLNQNKTATSEKLAQQTQSTGPIQTQPGSNGMQAELLSVQVTGEILTVTIRYVVGEDIKLASTNYPIKEVNYTDDATARQYGVLKDAEEKYLASPKSPAVIQAGEIINVALTSSGSEIAWFKFPAPPPEVQTISINIPEVAPFVGVEVQR